MKTPHIRITALLLSLLTAVPLLTFSACDQEDTPADHNTPNSQKTAEPVAVDYVWKTEYLTLPDNIDAWEVENPVYDGNVLSFSATRVIDEETYETEPVTISYDFTSGEITYASAPKVDEKTYGYAQYSISTPDGSSVNVFQKYDETNDATQWNMIKFAAEGTEIWSIDLGAQFKELLDTQWMYISDCMVDADGTIYAFAEQNILALSPDGERLFEINIGSYIDDVFTTADGTLYVSYYEWDEMTGNGGYVYRSVDTEKKALGDKLPIPDTINLDNTDIHMADGYDLYYTNSTGLFAFNFTDTEATQLCNWVNSDIIGDDMTYRFKVLSAERAVFLDNDPVSGASQLCVMTPVAPEDVTPKYIIEVAYTEYGGSMLPRYAVAFNRESDTYRVVLKDYADYDSPIDTLSQEIISGDVPDIILASENYNLPADTLVEQGLFLDLYTFMDAEGETMNRDAFVPCVLAPFEADDGTLPLLVQNFELSTFAAKTSLVGDKTAWTIDEIMAFAETLADDQYLFSTYYETGPEADPNAAAMQMLDILLPYSLSAFVNEETATCTFNDGQFAKLLQFCLNAPVINSNEVESETDLFREDKLVLVDMQWFSDISDYLQKKYYTFGGKDMTLIGYPTADESVTMGTAVKPLTMFGITKDSLVADGAWEFIKRTFGDADVEYYYRHNGFSSAYAALEAQFDEESRSYYVFEEYGWSGTHYDEDEEIDLSWMENNEGVPGHMEEEDKQALLKIFENATLVANTNQDIIDMIKEDVSAYFAGAKTLEDTVTIIQSRVSIFVAETMG